MEAPKCFKCGERHWSSQSCQDFDFEVKVADTVEFGSDAVVRDGEIHQLPAGTNVEKLCVEGVPELLRRRGRKKKYVDAAAKQRAYRLRKRKEPTPEPGAPASQK